MAPNKVEMSVPIEDCVLVVSAAVFVELACCVLAFPAEAVLVFPAGAECISCVDVAVMTLASSGLEIATPGNCADTLAASPGSLFLREVNISFNAELTCDGF